MATTKIHSNRHLHCKDNNYLIFFISYQIRVCKYLNKIKYKKVIVKFKLLDIELNNEIEAYILIEFENFWDDLYKKKLMDFGKM